MEIDAEANLPAWIVMGQVNRYAEDLGKAAVLRKAIEIKNIAQRRAFLEMNGVMSK